MVSHRWNEPDHPDRHGDKLREIRAFCQTHKDRFDFVFFDWRAVVGPEIGLSINAARLWRIDSFRFTIASGSQSCWRLTKSKTPPAETIPATKSLIIMTTDYPTKPSIPMGNQHDAGGGAPMEVSGKAVASMICGLFFFGFGIILGPIAICLGVSAKNKIKENPQALTGEGQATAGIVMGSIAVALWVITFILWVALVATMEQAQ
jgi:Domain of unknown function (DUF4190)